MATIFHLQLRQIRNLRRGECLAFTFVANGRASTHSTVRGWQALSVHDNISSSAAELQKQDRMMPFEEYKKIKKRLKWSSRLAGLPGFMVGSGISAAVNVHYFPQIMDFESPDVQPIYGLDPIVFAGLCGVGAGSFGLFVGAAMFNGFWSLMFRDKYKKMVERDKDFFKRIQQYRFTAFGTYEDDYYGDKIMTVSDYRQWRRQQQKKRSSAEQFEKEEKENDTVST